MPCAAGRTAFPEITVARRNSTGRNAFPPKMFTRRVASQEGTSRDTSERIAANRPAMTISGKARSSSRMLSAVSSTVIARMTVSSRDASWAAICGILGAKLYYALVVGDLSEGNRIEIDDASGAVSAAGRIDVRVTAGAPDPNFGDPSVFITARAEGVIAP